MNASAVKDYYAEQLSWPDARLFTWAGTVIGVPKAAPADSFVLHAPLELMARTALMRLVPPAQRESAQLRLVGLVAAYEQAGQGVNPPAPATPDSVQVAAEYLLKAIDASDLDEIDCYASWLGDNASAVELRRVLGPSLAPSLAAAAHAPIALHLLGRTPEIGGSVLRGAVREVGRQPEWVS